MRKVFLFCVIITACIIILAVFPNAFPLIEGLGRIWDAVRRLASILHDGLEQAHIWILELQTDKAFEISSVPAVIWIVAVNLIATVFFCVDRCLEEMRGKGITALVLIICAVIAPVGALLGVVLFEIKTVRTLYLTCIPLFLVTHAVILCHATTGIVI